MLKHNTIKWFFVALLVIVLGLSFTRQISWVYLIFILVIWLALTVWASFDIRLNYFVKAYSANKKTNKNNIALTFDDGPTEFTASILDLLQQYNQKATFFCIGKQVKKNPELAKRIVKDGHIIANHTYTHTTKMGFLPKKEVYKEIQLTKRIIHEITGLNVRLFRPPFGVTNPNIARACKESRVEVIGWNIRSLDTVLKSEFKIVQRVKKRLKKGSVILLHDTSQKTVNTLEQLLQVMNEKELKSVTIEHLIKIKAYQ